MVASHIFTLLCFFGVTMFSVLFSAVFSVDCTQEEHRSVLSNLKGLVIVSTEQELKGLVPTQKSDFLGRGVVMVSVVAMTIGDVI